MVVKLYEAYWRWLNFVALINEDKLEANYAEDDEEDDIAIESGDEGLDAYEEFDMVIPGPSHLISYINFYVSAFISNFSLFCRLVTMTRFLCSHIHVTNYPPFVQILIFSFKFCCLMRGYIFAMFLRKWFFWFLVYEFDHFVKMVTKRR